MENTEKTMVSLGFSGDLSFSGYYADQYREDLLAPEIKEFFAGNAANIINFESPITPCRITKKGYLAHRSDPQSLEFIKENIPSPILSFANNHMMDYGDIGVADTVDYTSAANIPIIGMGINTKMASNGIVIDNGLKIGVFAFEYKDRKIATTHHGGPLHESSIDCIALTIAELRKTCDYVVAVYHGGEEFVRTPMPYTRKFLRKILSLGTDVVVSHHSHVVQGYERIGKKMIFYSLGNFIFDTNYQRLQDYTTTGLLLRLNFTKDGFDFDTLPIEIQRDSHLIVPTKAIDSFKDIHSGYFRSWCTECVRVEVVKARKKKLKAANDEKIVTERLAQMEQVRSIVSSDPVLYADEQFLLDENHKKKANSQKKFVRKLIFAVKYVYRRLFVKPKETYKTIVKTFGAFIAKTVFRVKMEV